MKYVVGAPVALIAELLLKSGGKEDKAKAAEIRRQHMAAVPRIQEATKSVQRDQFRDDVDIELEYEVYSKE